MIKLGLGRVRRALARLGHPEESFASVVVAGTNGKGSVSALIESAARAGGVRTGLYTSPHLRDIRERVRVEGEMVPRAAWRRLTRRVGALRFGLTEFERQTLAAFLHFAERGVELAVAEVGLGGRLDAVNALPAPEATLITSIGHDHRHWLGPTLRHVYREKRGVARAGTPMIQSAPRALWPEGDRRYRGMGVPVWTLGRNLSVRRRSVDWRRGVQAIDVRAAPSRARAGWDEGVFRRVEVGLLGDHQVRNAALALAACRQLARRGWPLTERAVRKGFRGVRWPGRFQVVPGAPPAILDGAHNREAAEALAEALRASPWGRRPLTLIFGCLRDKDAPAMVRALRPHAGRVFLVPLPTPRARSPEELRPLWKGIPCEGAASVADAWRRAKTAGSPVLVTGSLFLVGETMKALGKVPS